MIAPRVSISNPLESRKRHNFKIQFLKPQWLVKHEEVGFDDCSSQVPWREVFSDSVKFRGKCSEILRLHRNVVKGYMRNERLSAESPWNSVLPQILTQSSGVFGDFRRRKDDNIEVVLPDSLFHRRICA